MRKSNSLEFSTLSELLFKEILFVTDITKKKKKCRIQVEENQEYHQVFPVEYHNQTFLGPFARDNYYLLTAF